MADRKNQLLLELMDAVDNLEERLNKINNVTEQIKDIKEDFSTVRLTLAKIEGQLSASKVNFNMSANSVDRVDASTTTNQNIKNGKEI